MGMVCGNSELKRFSAVGIGIRIYGFRICENELGMGIRDYGYGYMQIRYGCMWIMGVPLWIRLYGHIPIHIMGWEPPFHDHVKLYSGAFG